MDDIIGLMLRRNLISECFDIFNSLDNQSFVTCQLVCRSWKSFIDNYFPKCLKGRDGLRYKLNKNMFEKDYTPQITKIDIHIDKFKSVGQDVKENKFLALTADDVGILVFTLFHDVICFEPSSFHEIWRIKLEDEHFVAQEFYSSSSKIVRMNAMNRKFIFILTEDKTFLDENGQWMKVISLWIINRSIGNIVRQYWNVFQTKAHNIYHTIVATKVFDHRILCIASEDTIIFLHLPTPDVMSSLSYEIPCPLHKERVYSVNPSDVTFTCMAVDGKHLVSGSSNASIILWNFETYQKQNIFDLRQFQKNALCIYEIDISMPFVVAEILLDPTSESRNDCRYLYAIVVCNIITSELIRCIELQDSQLSLGRQFSLHQNLLCVYEGKELIDWNDPGTDGDTNDGRACSCRHGCSCIDDPACLCRLCKFRATQGKEHLTIYNFTELIRGNEQKRNFLIRQCYFDPFPGYGIATVGSNILTIENKQLVRRSFWP